MAEEGPFGQPEGEPLQDTGRAAYEQTLLYRRPETYAFPEKLTPEAVAISASELVDLFLERWYETAAVPSTYRVDDMVMSARERINQLRINMRLGISNPNYYTPTVEERLAGLVPGSFWRELPPSLLNDPTITIRQSDEIGPDGQPIRYWVKGGKDIGIFGYNQAEEIALAAVGQADKFRARFAIGIDVKETGPGGAKEKREVLADQIEAHLKQIEAWNSLLTKVNEQEAFADDLDNYIVKEFFRIGKAKMRAKFYAEILNAPPTKEGFVSFGEKIQAAHEAWRDIAEGRAVVELTLKDPTPGNPNAVRKETVVLPNPFAYARNQGLLDLCIRYVQRRVLTEKSSKIGDVEDKVGVRALEERDNKGAAIAGLVLFDHWDEDAAAALDILRTPQGAIEEVSFEIAHVDSTKLVAAPLRRQMEFWGFTDLKPKGKNGILDKRPHPREAGAPFTLRTLPFLSSHMLDVATVDVLATNGKEAKTIRVTIDQKANGVKDDQGKRIVQERSGRRFSTIRQAENSSGVSEKDFWVYEVTSLGDRTIWDAFQVVVGKDREARAFDTDAIAEMSLKDPNALSRIEREKIKMRILEGTGSFPYEVPHSLLSYYAYASLYTEFTRTDFEKQLDEYTEPDFAKLKKLNKQIALATHILQTANQISNDTIEELEEYLRISLAAGCLASVLRTDDRFARAGKQQEQQAQRDSRTARGRPEDITPEIGKLELALLSSRFVRTKSNEKGELDWERPKDRELFYRLIMARDQAPLSPFDLRKVLNERDERGRTKYQYTSGVLKMATVGELEYFNESQLKELKPIYHHLSPER